MNFNKTSACLTVLFSISPQAFADYFLAREYVQSEQIRRQLANAPSEYRFSSRFDGKDNVFYTGQVFRQVLIGDLKKIMGTLKRGRHNDTGETELSISLMMNVLNSYFAYDGDNTANAQAIDDRTTFLLSAKDDDGLLKLGQNGSVVTTYGNLAGNGKNLLTKIAGNDKTPWETNLRRGELKGWSTNFPGIKLSEVDRDGADDHYVEPEDLVDAFFQMAARLSVVSEDLIVPNGELKAQVITEGYITDSGLDLSQMVQKFLHGAVSFSQAASDYLYTGLSADNENRHKGVKNYTAREHHWDEAFGYFGAARNFFDYTTNGGWGDIDANGDGMIDINSEKILGVAKNTRRFDRNARPSENLQRNSFLAFVYGRFLLGTRPAGYEETTRQLAIVALGEWEKTIAATVIHYLNSTIRQMKAYGSESYSFKKHVKYWAEMKGYAMAAQFSPVAILSDSDFDHFHALVGDHPVLGHLEGFEDYRVRLIQACDILADAYEFSSYNKENW